MRTWDAIVSDQEVLTAEMRVKVDGEEPIPPEPPDGDVIHVSGDLALAIKNAPAGAILDLGGQTFTCAALKIDKTLTMRNGDVLAATNVSDILELRGTDITLEDLTLRGNGTTKRGISNQAINTVLRRVEVRNICREGQETQAMAMWDSPGPLLAEDCYFEGGSIGFLAGGSAPTVPNTIATGLKFVRCKFLRPIEWRSKSYACKNAFELKCARNVEVIDCELGFVWAQGQSGYCIQFTPSQYGGSPETTVENVVFRNCTIHDAGGGVNALGYSQHDEPDRVTQRGGNYRFEGCTFNLHKSYEGQAAVVTCAHAPHDVSVVDCDVTSNGDAFLRFSDKEPVDHFVYEGGRVNVPGTYGVFSPLGNRGANWQQIAPGGTISGVTFVNAHSTFKSNFPQNTYETAPVTMSLALDDTVRDRLEDAAIAAKQTLADYIARKLSA